jgi:hypothetical protein
MQPNGQELSASTEMDSVIDQVKTERWMLRKKQHQPSEADSQEASACEAARDQLIQWCMNCNPSSFLESWQTFGGNDKIVTELQQKTTGEGNVSCSRE